MCVKLSEVINYSVVDFLTSCRCFFESSDLAIQSDFLAPFLVNLIRCFGSSIKRPV